MNVTALLTALVIVFICLFAAGLTVYAVFFAIHKKYFRREVNLVKKYNSLINGLNGINIFKIQVLASNDIGDKLDLKKYIRIYKQLKENSVVIKANIMVAEGELNAFNLEVAKKYIGSITKDLDKALTDLNQLQDAYTNYTSYGHAIETAFQNYLEIYEALASFYEKKLEYYSSFHKVNALFSSIRKTFESVPKLAIDFDYKKTVDTIVDLGRKLGTLASAIMLVFKFQVVDTYLKTTRDYNEKIVAKHYDEIATSDLQALQNLLTLFSHAYARFNQHYKNLELGQAKSFAIQAINALNQINHFTYIHLNTPSLIDVSINEIKDQTDRILLNRDDIVNSMHELKQYFVLEPKIIDSFDTIEKNVDYISRLNNAANHVNYKTHTEKIKAVKDLDGIAERIVERKLEIVKAIDQIDDMLLKVVKTVTDLNDLYIYFWQLLTIVKQAAPNDKESASIQMLIKNSLNQIEEYSKQIVTNDNPDFDNIAYQVSSIVEQSQQIYKRMTTTLVLKTYATKLFVYVNRYKKNKSLTSKFDMANKLFKSKEYGQCIDQLLEISKEAKKNKK